MRYLPASISSGTAMSERVEEPYFRFGEGKISGWISVSLGALSVLGVLCFHFPDFLTTPQLRGQAYTVEQMRWLWCRDGLLGRVRADHLYAQPPQADGRHRHQPDPAGAVGRRRQRAGRAALCGARLCGGRLVRPRPDAVGDDLHLPRKAVAALREQAILRPDWWHERAISCSTTS